MWWCLVVAEDAVVGGGGECEDGGISVVDGDIAVVVDVVIISYLKEKRHNAVLHTLLLLL